MRLRSFFVLGVFGMAAVACGSGTGSAVDRPIGDNTPSSASQTPGGSNTVPGNPNQPGSNPNGLAGGGGTICAEICSLIGTYPCLDLGTNVSECLAQCQDVLANGIDNTTPECAKASADLIICADAHGDLACSDNGLDIRDSAAQDCASELSAYTPCIQVSGGSCQAGVDCSGCQDSCESCQCSSPSDPTVCDSICGTTNGGPCTLSGDQCAGCADTCLTCLCITNNDQTQCASSCAG